MHLQRELGLEVIVAAADTYRAAAVEQLTEWAERAGCQIVKGTEGGDLWAVAFDAIAAAKACGADVVICDTAGRLHTKIDLMEELSKVRRVIDKQLPGAPHETLVVIDATTGRTGSARRRSSPAPRTWKRRGADQARRLGQGRRPPLRSPPSSASW